ncbi:integrase core domain-containing protein [Gluconobacter wancherniae]|uniref:hypothetical protein n=1 Tax=Gluconobacter wancherniae TaxID=1307955 RepID=UPI001B8B83B0|nr:hypothetical protein [Gluconobacter wancherniae]MBS1089729.1 hypothetical protein [Gluconobacter wancherniae]
MLRHYTAPAAPVVERVIESFNGHLLRNLDRARTVINAWRIDYNAVGHRGITPKAFAQHLKVECNNAHTLTENRGHVRLSGTELFFRNFEGVGQE